MNIEDEIQECYNRLSRLNSLVLPYLPIIRQSVYEALKAESENLIKLKKKRIRIEIGRN